MRRFKTNVLSSFIHYIKLTHDLTVGKDSAEKESERYKNLAAGVDALILVGKSSFYSWDDASGMMFCMWPKYIRHECRDGCELSVKGNIPRFTKKQRMPMDELEFDMVKKKIEKAKNRQYITSGTVLSLTILFCVPNGGSDIRLVYNLTACSLNESLWAPKFWIPCADNVVDTTTPSSWFGKCGLC